MYNELDGKVPADHFLAFVQANVDNACLTDAEFRKLIRNTFPIVKFKRTCRCPHGVSELNNCVKCD